jgi:putative phage-type endonuclease
VITEEQANERVKGIGGSDVAAILGISPWQTAVDIWMVKTGRVPVGAVNNRQMRYGNFIEHFIAQEYEAETGEKTQRYQPTIIDRDNPVFRAHIDRLIVPEGKLRVSVTGGKIRTHKMLEIKSTRSAEGWGESGSTVIPAHIQAQVAWCLMLTKCQTAGVAVLIGNSDLRVYQLHRDLEIEEMLRARMGEWWNRHVHQGIMPEPTCENDVKLLYPQDAGKVIAPTPEIVDAVMDLKAIEDMITKNEADAETVRTRIKSFMADAAEIEGLATWKTQTAKRFDSVKFRADNPDLCEAYIKESTSRVFRLKKSKEVVPV